MNHTTKPINHPYLFSYRPALLAATIAALYLAFSPTAVLAADIVGTPGTPLIINTNHSGDTAYGVKETTNDAENGVVDIQTGGKIDDAWGGYSIDGIAKTNQASLSGGEAKNVIGGHSKNNDADNNQVSISAGPVAYDVTGGSASKDATNNRVSITGGQMRLIRGGFSIGAGSAKDNQVSITGGEVSSGIYGGLSNDGDTTNNRISIGGGTVDGVYGGYAKHHANDNQVSISAGTVKNLVYGGYSQEGTATNNHISITGGTVENFVYGGGSSKGTATNNHISITGGTVEGGVAGGRSYEGTATNNHVSISGGTFSNYIAAGHGWQTASTVTDNTLTIEGGTFKATVQLLGYAGSAATTGGNSMHLKIAGLTINNISTFNNLYFYLPNSVQNGDSVAILQDAAGTDLSSTVIGVCATAGSTLAVGDEITLIDAAGTLQTSSDTPANNTGNMTGCSPDYEFTLQKVNNALIATVTKAPAAAPQQGAQPVPGLGAKTLALLMLIFAAITAWFIHRRSAITL